jgi:thymidine kinase
MNAEHFPYLKADTGWVEVITGSMFSGKTEELIRRLKRAMLAHQHVEVYKPVVDGRYSHEDVVSHDETSIRATPVNNPEDLIALAMKSHVVGIEEAQFFPDSLLTVVNQLANYNKRVVVAGLDMDFKGRPFGPIPALMACADFVTKLHAICVRCGNPAQYSFRNDPSEELVMLGDKKNYEPLCRKCFRSAMNHD